MISRISKSTNNFFTFYRLPFSHPLIKTNPAYNFCKKLKQKLREQLQKDKLSKPQIVSQNKSILKIIPTLAQQRQLNLTTQLAPIIILLINCISFLNQPFSNLFTFSLVGADKFITLVLLANINYPQNKYMKYSLVGTIFSLSFIPIFNYYSLSVQLLELVLILLQDNQKIDINTSITQQQRQIISSRLQIKLALYFGLTSIFLLKLYYLTQIMTIQNKIKEYNQSNAKDKEQQQAKSKKNQQGNAEFGGWSKADFVQNS